MTIGITRWELGGAEAPQEFFEASPTFFGQINLKITIVYNSINFKSTAM
jgi:hypothetical protein